MKQAPRRKPKPRTVRPSTSKTTLSHCNKYKSIFQNAIEGIFQSTLDGKFLTANPSFIAMLGFESLAELKKTPLISFFVNPEERTKQTQLLKEQGYVRNFELHVKRRDGSRLIISESSRLVKDRRGVPQYIEGMVIDITERKQIEEQLRAAELKYQSIFNNAVEGIYQTSPDGTLITANAAFLSIVGYSGIEDIEDSNVRHLYVNPRTRETFREIVERDGIITDFEIQLRRKDGKVIIVLLNSRAVHDEKKRIAYYEGLIQDITKRKAQEEQLRIINAQKDKFLSIVSHDLRAPFNSILGFSELLMDETNPLPPDEQKEFIRFINEAAKQQLLLLTNLLDWSRFETGRMKFSFKPVRLADIVGKCIVTLFGNARKKQIALAAEIGPDETVYGDEYLLQQLFTNLISNAIKFTPPEGSVTVRSRGIRDHFLTVAITDTGVGIAPEDQKKLFHIETKHTTRGTEGEEGSGLGLVLCAEIVEKHGGLIRVESEEGKGTSFIFTLLLPRRTVLIAEDDKADRMLIVRYVEQLYPELTILEAPNGEVALQMAGQHLPSVIIADFVMPGMDGLRLIKELRKNPATKGIPVISMTSVQSQGSVAELRAAGAFDVLMKPFTKSELKALLNKFIK